MLIDLILGIMWCVLACVLGFEWNSLWLILFTFLPDIDLLWNEFFRIFIKKEKKFNFSTLLDEYSYTHKFWLHNPLLLLPGVFIIVYFIMNSYLFAGLSTAVVLFHLIHDTVDQNFDGVRWLWPLTNKSYKLRFSPRLSIYKKTPEELKIIAYNLSNKARKTKQILLDNKK